MKKLYAVDLSKNNFNIEIDNSVIIYLNSGNINSKNSKIIKLNKISYGTKAKKIFQDSLNKIFKKSRLRFKNELEIFNLRNDKNLFYDKIINILKIKNFINKQKKNIYDFHYISDDEKSTVLLSQIKNKFTNGYKIKEKKKTNIIKSEFYFFKFIIKVFLIIFIIKIFNQKSIINLLNKKKKIGH